MLRRLYSRLDVILQTVRWYVAYSFSLRDQEEILAERDMDADQFYNLAI